MAEKEMPTTEYSLKSISWHLKVLVEEMKALNGAIAVLVKSKGNQRDNDVF
jgi:hypothetical protein